MAQKQPFDAQKKQPVFCEFATEIRVPFFDVDSMEIVWHGHYVKYLEEARCAFLTALNYDYNVMRKEGYAWPVVHLQLKYVRPAQFGQLLRVVVKLVEFETYLKLDYEIRDAHEDTRLTLGSTTQVAVAMATRETQIQTPASWQNAVRDYLHQAA
ncbi:thioesterase family protein [Snodgrassella sp. CFCC 13594]|uniref:acyl-CoA thioesterase n=1 Tax=Snodgrassella sp. CFCC 13594 TaxID=1775559 RepID=UPI00082B60BA|nr:thioesterase family protein [Snodgrassella sp. CFCC 13594]